MELKDLMNKLQLITKPLLMENIVKRQVIPLIMFHIYDCSVLIASLSHLTMYIVLNFVVLG